MNELLILATRRGLFTARWDDGWGDERHFLDEGYFTGVIAREGVILAGSREGVFLSDDLGQTWRKVNRGLSQLHVRWMAFHPHVSDLEYVGTEPAGIFYSQDGGEHWIACPEVFELRDKFGWWLPYSPESGCVRGLAFHGLRGYAAVEVGGMLRSDDRGKSWRLVAGSDGRPRFQKPAADHIHPDVHSVEVHLSSPDLVFAPTNGGLYRSADGGEVWQRISEPRYTRAVWLDPEDPDHLVAGPASGVDSQGTILETLDNGNSWNPIIDGLEAPWPHTMVERFTQVGSTLVAVLSNGKVFTADISEWVWRPILNRVNGVNAVTTMYRKN